jgi:hypothetical protein
MTDTLPTQSTRPTFTVRTAAEATGKSRRTIGRMLEAGELEGATKDEESGAWSIPTEALLGAGLRLHAPSPPDAVGDEGDEDEAAEDDRAELLAELADWRRRAEVAEAIADERAASLSDMRTALELANRMLPAGPRAEATDAAPAKPRRKWWRGGEGRVSHPRATMGGAMPCRSLELAR